MRVALVHDYLTQYGGAERVLEHLHDLFPDATVHTSFVVPDNLPASFQDWTIRTSPLARLPVANRNHRLWLPLYPAIFGEIGRSIDDVDVAIADSSAWAHHAAPRHDIPMLCYCHSPARFLYGDQHYLGATRIRGPVRRAAAPGLRALAALDRRAARRVTRYIANSATVARRIADAYGIEASVVHPPVDIGRFAPQRQVAAENWFLVVSRLVPHKWIDIAVRACTAAGVQLKIIGEGRALTGLRALASNGTEFLGPLTDREVVDHMQRCQALILPGVEDFGMTAVEVQAAGRPVLAAGAGGALETVSPGETGLLWSPHSVEALVSAIHDAQRMTWNTLAIQRNASRFSSAIFTDRMREELGAINTR